MTSSSLCEPYRRIHPSDLTDVKDHLQEMQEAGVIRPSKSPFASPIVIVRKKDVHRLQETEFTHNPWRIPHSLYLKTHVHRERVCGTDTSMAMLIPNFLSRYVRRMRVPRVQRASEHRPGPKHKRCSIIIDLLSTNLFYLASCFSGDRWEQKEAYPICHKSQIVSADF